MRREDSSPGSQLAGAGRAVRTSRAGRVAPIWRHHLERRLPTACGVAHRTRANRALETRWLSALLARASRTMPRHGPCHGRAAGDIRPSRRSGDGSVSSTHALVRPSRCHTKRTREVRSCAGDLVSLDGRDRSVCGDHLGRSGARGPIQPTAKCCCPAKAPLPVPRPARRGRPRLRPSACRSPSRCAPATTPGIWSPPSRTPSRS